MRRLSTLLLAGIVAACISSAFAEEKTPAALNFKMKSIAGQEVDLAKYKGKVLLVVNVASKCGLTPQYEKLEALNAKYSEKGLAVLGFPCNQFGGQEPDSDAGIKEFCESTYKVKFDMFSKVEVNGKNACDFYKTLKATETAPVGPGEVKWNFEKFLIDREGKVIARFAPRTDPSSEEVVKAIEAALGK